MSETTQGPEIKIVGYCRACGVGLDEANVRTANGTIYCAEHVPVVTAPPPASEYSPYTAPAPPPNVGEGSPGAAFVLGMIPGVGAIYNGQYGKGIVHVIILALLFMAADNSSGATPLFALLIPGFWFYMAFEAYHTARRRRQGLPIDEFSGLSMNSRSRFPVAAVLLIVFGVIFLLDNLGWFELRQVLKFWPVGMIALGVYLLYARMAGGSDEPR
jgi:TM2 domain-containing membrane protein YozV